MRSRSLPFWLLAVMPILLLMACSVATAEQEDSPYRISWPAGWTVQESPIPKKSGSAVLDAGRVAAAHIENGTVGVIELVYRRRKDKDNLDSDFERSIQDMATGFRQQKMKVDLGKTDTRTVSGFPAKSTDFSVSDFSGPNRPSKQSFVVIMSPKYTYSLSLTATPESFEHFRPDFEKVLMNAVLR